jgi:hypothetical protein
MVLAMDIAVAMQPHLSLHVSTYTCMDLLSNSDTSEQSEWHLTTVASGSGACSVTTSLKVTV